MMYEEVAAWVRVNSGVAVRYVGFRNLETKQVWIAFANYIGGDEEVDGDGLLAPHEMLQRFLEELPSQADAWRPSLTEAITHFIAINSPG
jgi:hypothetical protein